MTPERHAQIKALFLAACARPAGERAAFVEQACRQDPELKFAVEQLLAGHSDEATRAAGEERPAAPFGPAVPERVGRDFGPGTIVAGRFRIVELLGRGGMGEVYRADDLTLDQPVALKFLPVALAGDPVWSAQLRQEVRLAREITHPNVCRIHDFTLAGDDSFISMEYVDGEDLRVLLKRIGHVPADRALEIARQLCAGLAAAHARGVLHRDLKPSNVMIDGRGRARILDFGLATVRSTLTPADIRSGTPAYMAPEQLSGREVSVRSDVYALGLVLYELFTGRPAFAAGAREAAPRHDPKPPTPATSLVRDLDPRIERTIERCVAFDPAQRPASALAVLAALPGGDALAAAQSLGTVPSPSLVASVRPQRRFSAGMGLAALLAGLVLLAIMVVFTSQAHPIAADAGAKAPGVLADRARTLLGEGGAPVSEAWGFTDQLAVAVEPGALADQNVAPVLGEGDRGLLFWYRRSARPLVSSNPLRLVWGAGRAGPRDPPLSAVGDVLVVLDGRGRLRALEARPDELRPGGSTFGLEKLLAAAEISPDGPTTAPRLVPPVAWDSREAWPALVNGTAARVEYAALRGQPAAFAVLPADTSHSEANRIEDAQRRERLRLWLELGWVLVAFPVAAVLAWRHAAGGVSDVAGAMRLATAVLLLRSACDVLRMQHVGDGQVKVGLLLACAAGGLLEAALVWLMYGALEPLVRRFWPETELSWTRLLGGRWRDPLVGRDVLVGAAAGVAWALLSRLADLAPGWLGYGGRVAVRPEAMYLSALGVRPALAVVLDGLRWAVYWGLLGLLLIVLLRWCLRRAWLAGAVAALLLAPLGVVGRPQPLAALVLVGLVMIPSMIAVLIRYGLLAGVTGMFVGVVLARLPLTLELSRWYADVGLVGAVVAGFLLVIGFGLARGRGSMGLEGP